MNIKFALMLCVASLSAFSYAQEVPKSTETLSRLSKRVQTAALSLDQRKAKLENLALLPADTSACFALLGMRDVSLKMTQQWLEVVNALAPDKAKEELKKLPAAWYGVKDVIVTGEPQLIADIAPMLEKIGPIYAASAEAQLRGTVVSMDETKTILSDFVSSFGAWMEQERMAPLLAIVSMEPELLSSVKQGLSRYIQLICSADPLLGIKEQQLTYQGIEFSGFYLDGKMMAAMTRDALKRPGTTVNVTEKSLEDWLKGLEKFSFSFLVAYKDDKVIISLSRDPKKDLKLAASPKESILATDKLAFTDQAAQILCIGYADAAASEAFMLLKQKAMQGVFAGLQYIAKNMSDTMISLDALNAHWQNLLSMSQAGKATTLLAWWDKGLQMEVTAPDSGSLAMGKPLKMASFADRPENILYAATSLNPQYLNKLLDIYEDALSVAWQFTECVLPVLTKEVQYKDSAISQFAQIIPLVQMGKTELAQIWSQAKLALSGLDSYGALVINDPSTKEEPHTRLTCVIPHFAYANGVCDLGKMTSAGEIIKGSLSELLGSYAEPTTDTRQNRFALQKTEKQGMSTYSYPSPFGMAGCEPCLSISDKVFIVGSLPAFNQEVAEVWSASQTDVFEGAMFAFKLAPALKMLSQNLSLMVPRTKKGQNDELLNIIKRVDQLFQGVYGIMKTEEGLTRWRLSIPIK